MASSTSSSLKVNKGSQQYPYPSHVNAASFVSIILSRKSNYKAWREQMLCLVYSHDMLGFLDGTLTKPQENNGTKTIADMEAFQNKYWEWKRSDTLVKGWIFGSLSEDVMGTVIGLETAREVWNKVETDFTTLDTSKDTNITTDAHIMEKGTQYYIPLCRAIETGDWEKAQEFLNRDKKALTAKLNVYGDSSLHVAIGNPKNMWILQNLLDRFDPELLPGLLDCEQNNVLHHAARHRNIEAAKKLLEKNPNLLFFPNCYQHLPIHLPIVPTHKETFLYLNEMCKQHIWLSKTEGCHNPFEGQIGALLLRRTILSRFLDVAYDLLKDYPELATTMETKVSRSPLLNIASLTDAYLSSKRYNFYERFVYYHLPTNKTNSIPDIENQVGYEANFFAKSSIYQVPLIKQLYEDKVEHNTTLRILNFICQELAKLEYDPFEHYHDAFISVVRNDTPEIIELIIQTFPKTISTRDNQGYTVSQLSILNRSEQVYNFLVQKVYYEKNFHNLNLDRNWNNILHLAGRLAPDEKHSMVNGAALQMQKELKWFQEVRNIVLPGDREAINREGETPTMVFRKEHEVLRQKAEEWIKKTADSCIITTALITTIAFAAVITVPGGNNGNTGKAIYETRTSFIIFSISNAISLFTSTTSLLLFLSILTTRYAQEDFLYMLPKRLILGLMLLFISVTAVIISFSTALYLMSGHGKSWMIPISTLAGLPVASFLKLQLPLLVDLISSTYGQGIIGKQSKLKITS